MKREWRDTIRVTAASNEKVSPRQPVKIVFHATRPSFLRANRFRKSVCVAPCVTPRSIAIILLPIFRHALIKLAEGDFHFAVVGDRCFPSPAPPSPPFFSCGGTTPKEGKGGEGERTENLLSREIKRAIVTLLAPSDCFNAF